MIAALATLLAIDAPWAHRGILLASVLWPVPSALAILSFVAPVDPQVGAIVAIGSELRSGAPLRSILAQGALGPEIASRARAGGALAGLDEDLRGRFGADAPLVAASLRMATVDGGPAADVFDSLASAMLDVTRTRRERRAAMAPAVLQATVVGGAPMLALAHLAASGRLEEMLSAGGAEAATVLVGLCLTLIGTVTIVAMAVRGGRR